MRGMNLVLPIPDEVAGRLGSLADATRRALEAFGLAEYCANRLTEAELRCVLGIKSRYELDGFLKQRGVFLSYTAEDIQRDQDTLDRLGV